MVKKVLILPWQGKLMEENIHNDIVKLATEFCFLVCNCVRTKLNQSQQRGTIHYLIVLVHFPISSVDLLKVTNDTFHFTSVVALKLHCPGKTGAKNDIQPNVSIRSPEAFYSSASSKCSLGNFQKLMKSMVPNWRV